MKKVMTAAEFTAHWLTPDEDGRTHLSWTEESIGEHEAEYRNECAMFGDAGPGTGLRLSEMKRDLAQVKARLVKLGAL